MITVPNKVRYPSATAITRAVNVAKKCGLDVAEIEVKPDGSIRVGEARAASQPSNDFDRWESQL